MQQYDSTQSTATGCIQHIILPRIEPLTAKKFNGITHYFNGDRKCFDVEPAIALL